MIRTIFFIRHIFIWRWEALQQHFAATRLRRTRKNIPSALSGAVGAISLCRL